MGTKVQSKSYMPIYHSMRDLNEDSNSCSWPLYYGDKTLTNGQYYNAFLPRSITDAYLGDDKDAVKQKMLEHEATFKNQVYELHRLYRIQRDLMNATRRKELHKNQIPVEPSFSSVPLPSQITSEDARKWHIPSFTVVNSVFAGPSATGVEGIHSPLSSRKGKGTHAGLPPYQNGGSSKDFEVLDARPTKVRKKMIDLQLPAEEYIDTEDGEQFRDEKVSGMPSYLPNGDHKISPESGVKMFLGSGGKTGSAGDALRSDSGIRSTKNLADLNEPVQVEETNDPSYVDLRGHTSCHGEIHGQQQFAKPKSQVLGMPKEYSPNSFHGSNNRNLITPHQENNGNGRRWFSHVLEAGNISNLQPVSQGFQPEKLPVSSQQTQVLLSRANEFTTFFRTDQNKVDPWRKKTVCSLETLERNHEMSKNNHLDLIAASHVTSLLQVTPSSDLTKSWSHSVSSWEKPNGSLSQTSKSVQTNPCVNPSAALSKSSQSPAQGHGIFGDRWHFNRNSSSHPGLESEIPHRNGFYNGSSSGSKDLPLRFPSVSYDYLTSSKDNNVAPDHFIDHGFPKHKHSNCTEERSAKEMNLNVVLSSCSSSNAVSQQGLEIMGRETKHDDHLAVLPWFRAKPSCKNEATSSGKDLNMGQLSFFRSSNHLSSKTESGTDPNHNLTPNVRSVTGSNDAEAKRIEIGDCSRNRKLLGFPIFDKPHISKNDSCSLSSSHVSLTHPSEGEDVENNRKDRVFDINLPCDPAVPDLGSQVLAETQVVEKGKDTSSFRHHIDLNLCISEDEASLIPSVQSTNMNITSIDLEVPALPETEEDVTPGEESQEKLHQIPLQSPQHKAEQPHPQDDLIKIAAEAIVAISSSSHHIPSDNTVCHPSENSTTDPLQWFVEIVSSCGEDLDRRFDSVLRGKGGEDNGECSLEEIDFFESMTLKLIETKEEDYVPKPLVPEDLKLEESGATLLPQRSRRGQARRGRQWRDFQRDILPGIASLSRHEVTEDLQTFGGLMRATGHSWQSGLTRRNSTRNGCARGRRRSAVSPSPAVAASKACTQLVQQLNNIEVGLEDRSLTGWGKTTRRPRRQRCPAGNPPPIPLT